MTQSARVQAFLFLKNWRNAYMSNNSNKNRTFAYPGQAALFDHANFELDTSWRLGLLGRNGRVKTTLFKLLQNKLS